MYPFHSTHQSIPAKSPPPKHKQKKQSQSSHVKSSPSTLHREKKECMQNTAIHHSLSKRANDQSRNPYQEENPPPPQLLKKNRGRMYGKEGHILLGGAFAAQGKLRLARKGIDGKTTFAVDCGRRLRPSRCCPLSLLRRLSGASFRCR